MWTNSALLALGAVLLAFSGDRLVEFAAALARRARLTPAVIGLTVVAAGTSMPELSVSVTAALKGSSDIAVGNAVGSNIANIGFILGACALLAPIPVSMKLLRFEYPFMLLSSWMLFLLCRDGRLDRLEAAFFLLSMAAFIAYAIWVARHEVSAAERKNIAEEVPAGPASRSLAVLMAGIVASLGGLAIGADIFVRGAVGIASSLGISERVIGLTIVAVGTSLPELVASAAAAYRKHHDMAVANVIGSNIFNVLLILGTTGLIRPIAVSPQLVVPDMVVMIAFSALLFPLVIARRTLNRLGGAALLATYGCYVVALVSGR